jgi:hypothetical protein
MNKILIIILLIAQVVFANSNLIAGYGVSSYDVPLINYGNVFSHNVYVGVEQSYDVNANDHIVLSMLMSTNRRFNTTFLTELELQIGFKKNLTEKSAFAFGWHVSHLLNEHISEVDLIGAGFGLNMAYTYQYSDQVSLNLQIHTTSYGVASPSSDFDRFTNQTIRTFLQFTSQ